MVAAAGPNGPYPSGSLTANAVTNNQSNVTFSNINVNKMTVGAASVTASDNGSGRFLWTSTTGGIGFVDSSGNAFTTTPDPFIDFYSPSQTTLETGNGSRISCQPDQTIQVHTTDGGFIIDATGILTFDYPPVGSGASLTLLQSGALVGSIPITLLPYVGFTNAYPTNATGVTVTGDRKLAISTNYVPLGSLGATKFNSTNVSLSAASTYTWTFINSFANTNFSVSVSGGAATLVAPIIGAKTTNSVVITFTAYTGILNAIAIQ